MVSELASISRRKIRFLAMSALKLVTLAKVVSVCCMIVNAMLYKIWMERYWHLSHCIGTYNVYAHAIASIQERLSISVTLEYDSIL